MSVLALCCVVISLLCAASFARILQLNGGTGQIAAGQPIQLHHSVCTGKPSLTYCSYADRQFGNDGGDGGDDGGNIDGVWPAVAAAPTCAPCCSPNCTARSAAGAPASQSVALGRTLQRQLVTHDAHCCFLRLVKTPQGEWP